MMLKRRALLTTSNLGLSLSTPGVREAAINLNLRPHQAELVPRLRRFSVLLAHRRFGKTVAAIGALLLKGRACEFTRPETHYFAPTYRQAKRVAWAYVHELCEPIKGTRFLEGELRCELPWGAAITLGGADNPDSHRGVYSDYAVIDEPAQQPSRMWTEILRPALSDRKGGALFIGTPKGRHGLFHDQWQYAMSGADPEWIGLCYKASETGLIDEAELASARRTMTQAEYDQEYECDWNAAIAGAYYAEWMQRAQAEGRITDVLPYPNLPVYASFDIGVGDASAVWLFQLRGDSINFIEYCEFTGMGMPQIATALRAKGYTLNTLLLPHDVRVREWATGETRVATLRSLGFTVIEGQLAPIQDGIDQVRNMLSRCRFDQVKCAAGIECLWHYRSEWQEVRGIFKRDPLHDWSSHGADSLRTLAAIGTSRLQGFGRSLNYSGMDGARCS